MCSSDMADNKIQQYCREHILLFKDPLNFWGAKDQVYYSILRPLM